MARTSARTALKRLAAVLGVAAVSAAAVVGVTTLTSDTALAAPSGDAFDPGYIISDERFFDADSMTVGEIQAFLNDKGRNCKVNCLKDYRGDIVERPADPNRCTKPIAGKKDASAATIIHDVAEACGVSPQVILVTLQKEMSLVTMDNPSKMRYDRAMGFACPDSSPGCNTAYAGFASQVYFGAGQFQRYGKGTFTWYPVGQVSNILYHPTASKKCGSSPVLIQNRATAALYYYTPYQPNQAALDNLYGEGDRCSSYGNRNFWRMFWDWFGDPTSGKSQTCVPADQRIFCDVAEGGPFSADIKWMVDAGITSGYDDDTFRPGNTLTRQAMAAFLYRMEDTDFIPPTQPTFTDVPVDHSFYAEIEWLADSGAARGYDDGTFRPTAHISRQAMSAFMFRLDMDRVVVLTPAREDSEPVEVDEPAEQRDVDEPADQPEVDEPADQPEVDEPATDHDGEYSATLDVPAPLIDEPGVTAPEDQVATSSMGVRFADVDLGHEFFHAIQWLSQMGISEGYADGTFRPTDAMTRRATAAFLYRYFEVRHGDI